MTDRAEIVARICDRLQFIRGIDPAAIAHDRPLAAQGVDSLDRFDLELDVEDEFGIAGVDWMPTDASIDSIADAVIAATK